MIWVPVAQLQGDALVKTSDITTQEGLAITGSLIRCLNVWQRISQDELLQEF